MNLPQVADSAAMYFASSSRVPGAGSDVRLGGGHGREIHRQPPGQQLGDRRRAALVGDVHDVDAGHVGEQLARQVRGRADAGGTVIQLAGCFLASAIGSGSVFPPRLGGTTSTLGMLALLNFEWVSGHEG